MAGFAPCNVGNGKVNREYPMRYKVLPMCANVDATVKDHLECVEDYITLERGLVVQQHCTCDCHVEEC